MAEKFTFDAVFNLDETGAKRPTSNAHRKYSVTEVEEIRSQAYTDGLASAEAQAAEQVAAAANTIASLASDFIGALDAEVDALRRDAAELALVAARALTDGFTERFGEDMAAEAIGACLDRLRGAPRIEAVAPADLSEDFDAKLIETATARGLAERIIIRRDPNLAAADFSLRWDAGEMQRDGAASYQAVKALIDTHLDAISQNNAGPNGSAIGGQ